MVNLVNLDKGAVFIFISKMIEVNSLYWHYEKTF